MWTQKSTGEAVDVMVYDGVDKEGMARWCGAESHTMVGDELRLFGTPGQMPWDDCSCAPGYAVVKDKQGKIVEVLEQHRLKTRYNEQNQGG